MRVKMISCACGPNGNFQPEQIYDVPEQQARDFVDGKYATWVDAPPEPKPEKKTKVKETAALDKTVETAAIT